MVATQDVDGQPRAIFREYVALCLKVGFDAAVGFGGGHLEDARLTQGVDALLRNATSFLCGGGVLPQQWNEGRRLCDEPSVDHRHDGDLRTRTALRA